MKIKIILAIGMVLVLALAGLTGCSATGVAATDGQPVNVSINGQQGIWVNGEGKVTVTPDIANISLGVSAQSAKVADAQAEAATAMDKIMSALKTAGIDSKDIQTQYFNIQPLMRYDNMTQQSTITGYQVSNVVTVKVRKVETTGSLIDSVTAAGGDNTRVNGVSFSVDEPSKYYEQARTLAMQDAKAKATQLASLSSVTLGKVTYITENSYSQPYPISAPMYKSMDSAGAVPTTSINPGQTDITLNVQVAYSIQ